MLRFLIIFSAICHSFFAQVQNATDSDVQLDFVQAIWRHGDRAALAELFPITEQNWTFGGGGFGELTPIGMEQLNQLGVVLRRRYVNEIEFLSTRYAAREIYIRSTNVNRTILSAMSLAYGLFPAGAWNVQGVDYPMSTAWQQGFTFVPIHVDGKESCALSQNCDSCPRHDELKEKWTQIPEVQEASVKMKAFNRRVAAFYNISESSPDFLFYPDTWKCQRNWFNDILYRELPWYNEQIYQTAQEVFAPFKRFTEGLFENSTQVDGVDVALETQILQSGPLINDIYSRAQEKLDCVLNGDNCTSYTKPLKFYGYSSHDMNLYGLLVVLGIPDLVKSLDGWPEYSSAMVFEFYSNPSSSEQFFKLLYRDNADDDLQDVTARIPVCNGAQLCSMQNLQNVVEHFRPRPDYQTLCQTSINRTKSASGNFYSSLFFIILISFFQFSH